MKTGQLTTKMTTTNGLPKEKYLMTLTKILMRRKIDFTHTVIVLFSVDKVQNKGVYTDGKFYGNLNAVI